MRRAIGEAILALADDPTPIDSTALTGTLKGSRRLRVGHYRVGYQVERKARVVTVWVVGHRSRFYEKARRRQQPRR